MIAEVAPQVVIHSDQVVQILMTGILGLAGLLWLLLRVMVVTKLKDIKDGLKGHEERIRDLELDTRGMKSSLQANGCLPAFGETWPGTDRRHA